MASRDANNKPTVIYQSVNSIGEACNKLIIILPLVSTRHTIECF